jgi:hypothetical protein
MATRRQQSRSPGRKCSNEGTHVAALTVATPLIHSGNDARKSRFGAHLAAHVQHLPNKLPTSSSPPPRIAAKEWSRHSSNTAKSVAMTEPALWLCPARSFARPGGGRGGQENWSRRPDFLPGLSPACQNPRGAGLFSALKPAGWLAVGRL